MKLAMLALCWFAQDDLKQFMKGWKHPWAGWKEGSWAKFKRTDKGPFGDPVTEERTYRVLKVKGSMVDVQYGELEGEPLSQVYFVGAPSEFGGTLSRIGEEEIKVGDKGYKCTVHQIKRSLGNITQVTKIWRSPDAPVWAVKSEWRNYNNDKEDMSWVEDLTAVDQVIKAGDNELKCHVFRRTTTAMGARKVETEWRTPEVPGGAARREEKSYSGERESFSTTEELLSFEKK